MKKYTVHWVEKINVWAHDIEADSEEEAIGIAKTSKGLDIDSDSHASKPTRFRAVEEC